MLHVHETNGEVRVLFPNKKEKENKVQGGKALEVGRPGYYLKIGDDEAGNENFFVFVTSKRLEDGMKETLPDNLAPLNKAQKEELMSHLAVWRGGMLTLDDGTPRAISKLVLKSVS